MARPLSDYARAVPLQALSAYGLGPLSCGHGADPRGRLRSLRDSNQGVLAAIDTAGSTGRLLLMVVAALGWSATVDEIAFQTRHADPDVVTAALERLVQARLVERGSDGSVAIRERAALFVPGATISMADQNALTSDQLARMCKALGVVTPSRKQERIDAIAGEFADATASERVRSDLSTDAWALLDRIACAAGPGMVEPEQVDLDGYDLFAAASPRHAFQRVPERPEVRTLYELTSRGIVGTSDWENKLWIWREAWLLLERPFFTDWETPPSPVAVGIEPAPARVPGIVAVLDRAMQACHASPPSVLKNGDPRLAKSEVRALAKLIGVDAETVDFVTRLAIGIGLLLANTISEAGRGRRRTVDQVWIADLQLAAAWAALAPLERWLRLFAEWCRPSETACLKQLLVNRHLLMWELANLADDTGWADPDAFAAWFGDHYASLGHPAAVAECVADLAMLGIVNEAGPLALTSLGAIALRDPEAVARIEVSDAATAIVQADHTVVAPPDLRADLASRLATIASVENDAGAFVYRLDPEMITRAVQGGDGPDSIVDFLAQLSTVPLAPTVERLVRDAAARAGRVKVIAMPTVVVVSDPADLTIACSVKAAKLIAVSDTVAVSDLPSAKVRAALDRKGLAPEVVLGGSSRAQRTRTADVRGVERRPTGADVDDLPAETAAIREAVARLRVVGTLTVTPALVDRLDGRRS